MTAPILKKSLGEAGAFFGDSHGDDNLYDVLLAIVKAGVSFSASQATIATAVIGNYEAQFDGVIGDIGVRVGTCGDAGSTVVKVNKNGTALATIAATVAHDDADGTTVSTDLSGDAAAAFSAGDLISIEVTTAPTSGSDLEATLHLRPASIQA